MQHAAQTHGAFANKIANPHELEADLHLSTAAKLQAIRDSWASKSPISTSRRLSGTEW